MALNYILVMSMSDSCEVESQNTLSDVPKKSMSRKNLTPILDLDLYFSSHTFLPEGVGLKVYTTLNEMR